MRSCIRLEPTKRWSRMANRPRSSVYKEQDIIDHMAIVVSRSLQIDSHSLTMNHTIPRRPVDMPSKSHHLDVSVYADNHASGTITPRVHSHARMAVKAT